MDAQYAKEQEALSSKISELQKTITGYEQNRKSAERFIALIDKYENFDTLTNTMLNEFVEKIVVHERDRKGSVDNTQEVEIYFNFVGRYVPPHFREVKLTPEEQEALRNYLRQTGRKKIGAAHSDQEIIAAPRCSRTRRLQTIVYHKRPRFARLRKGFTNGKR